MNLPHRDFGWKFDLCSPHETPDPQLISGFIDPPPNHIDENHLELPTKLLKTRGVYVVGGSLILVANTLLMLNLIFFDLRGSWLSLDPAIVMFLVSLALFFWTPSYIRLDIGQPRDQPIRFNRHRRKAYFYRYKFDSTHPYGTKNWGVQPVAYNWDDLTAEVYRVYAPLGYGGIIEKVMISVRRHGTDEVIDRLFLTDDIERGKRYWALARLFMQKGPEALPNFVYAPVDWNSDDSTNPFDQLAPKVQWPPEMDLESRTAPAQGDQP